MGTAYCRARERHRHHPGLRGTRRPERSTGTPSSTTTRGWPTATTRGWRPTSRPRTPTPPTAPATWSRSRTGSSRRSAPAPRRPTSACRCGTAAGGTTGARSRGSSTGSPGGSTSRPSPSGRCSGPTAARRANRSSSTRTSRPQGHEFFSLGASDVSPDGNRLAYAVDVTGDERYDLHIRDLATGAELDDVVTDIGAGVAWSLDGRYVFYTRYDDAWRPFQVWRHEVGALVEQDVLVHEETDEIFRVGVGSSRDDRWVVIGVGSSTSSGVPPRRRGATRPAPRSSSPRGSRRSSTTSSRSATSCSSCTTATGSTSRCRGPWSADGDRRPLGAPRAHRRGRAGHRRRRVRLVPRVSLRTEGPDGDPHRSARSSVLQRFRDAVGHRVRRADPHRRRRRQPGDRRADAAGLLHVDGHAARRSASTTSPRESCDC